MSNDVETHSAKKSKMTPKDWKEMKAKKRKWKEEKLLKQLSKERVAATAEAAALETETNGVFPSPAGKRYTVSIALPGSILDNAQSPELRTYLVGQIARAAVVFKIDEIVVFDESGMMTKDPNMTVSQKAQSNLQMVHILQYLECPQYLRKTLFPRHPNLKFAGLLNPLDCPHHMRKYTESKFREGVVVDRTSRSGSFVNVGLDKEILLDRRLVPGVRVTVQLEPRSAKGGSCQVRTGKAVSWSLPSAEAGLYWGYRARLASSLGSVFKDSPYEGGYDLTIGTSEKGTNIDGFDLPQNFRHMLVVFGGLNGLEASLDADPDLDAKDPRELFQHYLNTCPSQGSRTIRTEEAILITLSGIRLKLARQT